MTEGGFFFKKNLIKKETNKTKQNKTKEISESQKRQDEIVLNVIWMDSCVLGHRLEAQIS